MAEAHKWNANIDPIEILIKREYLENFKGGFGEFIPGKLISIWAYPNHQPTFNVLLIDGTIFAYLPASAFVSRPISCHKKHDVWDACSIVCPTENFLIYRMALFDECKIVCFDPEKVFIGWAEKYHWTIEWPNENELLHLFIVESCLRLIPNHKMLAFPGNSKIEKPKLPTWKKLRHEWVHKNEQTKMIKGIQ